MFLLHQNALSLHILLTSFNTQSPPIIVTTDQVNVSPCVAGAMPKQFKEGMELSFII